MVDRYVFGEIAGIQSSDRDCTKTPDGLKRWTPLHPPITAATAKYHARVRAPSMITDRKDREF